MILLPISEFCFVVYNVFVRIDTLTNCTMYVVQFMFVKKLNNVQFTVHRHPATTYICIPTAPAFMTHWGPFSDVIAGAGATKWDRARYTPTKPL